MREAASTNQPFGLFPTDVEVTFNLSASRENDGELKLDLSAPASSPVTATAGGSASFKATATRGNQITVKFSNLLVADPVNTMIGKQGTNIVDLINYLQKQGQVATKKKK